MWCLFVEHDGINTTFTGKIYSGTNVYVRSTSETYVMSGWQSYKFSLKNEHTDPSDIFQMAVEYLDKDGNPDWSDFVLNASTTISDTFLS